eukprot:788227-Amphidinium_carterae.1
MYSSSVCKVRTVGLAGLPPGCLHSNARCPHHAPLSAWFQIRSADEGGYRVSAVERLHMESNNRWGSGLAYN